MKPLLSLLTLFVSLPLAHAQDFKTKVGLAPGQRIFFGGDSIESSYMYSHYVMAWLYLQYPELNLKIYHYGGSGTSLSSWAVSAAEAAQIQTDPNGVKYLKQSLFEKFGDLFQPDLVFFKKSTNGGLDRAAQVTEGTRLIENWIIPYPKRKLVVIGQWGSQQTYDGGTTEKMADEAKFETAYPGRVWHADSYTPIKTGWLANGDNKTIDLQQVGVAPASGSRNFGHPGPAGHFITAWATLKSMGAEALVSRAVLDAAASTATEQAKCAVSEVSLTATGGTFKRLDQSSPWAYDINGRANGNLFALTYGVDDGTLHDWQEYGLKVTGLNAGNYDILCDGEKIGTKTSTELAAGWNMAGLEIGPVFRQGQEVLGEIRDMQLVDRVTLAAAPRSHSSMYELTPFTDILYGGRSSPTTAPANEIPIDTKSYRGAQYRSEMATSNYWGGPRLPQCLDGELAQIHSAARPVTRWYQIVPAGTVTPPPPSQDPTCDLQVSVKLPTEVLTVNQPASYTVAVKNHGPSVAIDDTLTHTYSAGLTINSLSGDAVVQNTTARTITLAAPSLAVGASKTFVVNFTPVEKGSLSFSTSATTTTRELTSADNTVTGSIQVAGVEVGPEVGVAPVKSKGLRKPPVAVRFSSTSLAGRIAEALASPTFPMPPGIPDPSGWGMDPLRGAAPNPALVWANPAVAVTGNYYIDSTNPAATNNGNTYGYPNKPRATIPDNTYIGAGKLMYIAGGTYDSAGGDNVTSLYGAAVSGNPGWIVAAPAAQLTGAFTFSGNFLIVDGVKIGRGSTGINSTFSYGFSSSNYHITANWVCFRNGEVKDLSDTNYGFRSAVVTIGFPDQTYSHDLILFNTDILDQGNVTDVRAGIAENDEHGFHPSKYTEKTWVLGCRIHDCGGDSIQPNGNGATGDARTRYLYIGYNTFYHNGENAVDSKSARDMIVSSNLCYDFRTGFGSDGTALIAQAEGGSGSENCWYIFNDVSDAAVAFRVEEATPKTIYGIGNVFHDLNGTQQAVYTRVSGAALTLVDNTISGYPTNALAWDGQGATAPVVNLHGNLFSGKSGVGAYWIKGDATTNTGQSDYNLYDSANPFLVKWNSATYTTLASFRSGKGQDMHSIVAAPQFVGGTVSPYALAPGSPAINANVEDPVYATFQSLYGLDIRKDFEGKTRPLGGAWDIGAIEKE